MESSSPSDTPTTYPYEIHLTVHNPDPDVFRATCHLHGMKPIFLDLQTRTGTSIMRDVMTTVVVHAGQGEFVKVTRRARECAEALKNYGMNVVRHKIETVPWNPQVERIRANSNGYFEAHVQVFVQDGALPELAQVAQEADAHLSRNVFKAGPSHDVNIYVLTLRDYNSSYEVFDMRVAYLRELIVEYGFPIRKYEIEFAVHDSNQDHDSEWLKAL